MKLSHLAVLAALGMGLAAQSASAVTYTDVNTYTEQSGRVTFSSPLVDEFNIAALGYTPGNGVIQSASASFELYDNDRGIETVFINLGRLLSPVEFSGLSMGSFTLSWGTEIVGSLLLDLAADGKLKYTIATLPFQDFYVSSATLTATVPDSATTLALFGASLLGLVAFRRRIA